MKKILTVLCFVACLLFSSSCGTYASVSCVDDGEGFYTEYSYNAMPVIVINGYYYYRVFSGRSWVNYPVPRTHIRYIHRFDRPRYYSRPNVPRNIHRGHGFAERRNNPGVGRPGHHGMRSGDAPRMRQTTPPTMRNHNQPARGNMGRPRR